MAAPVAFDDQNLGTKLVASIRTAFNDQVDRWGRAEGFDLGRGCIGPDDFSIGSMEDTLRLHSCAELLFEWGARLRLGERFLAEGIELADVRFSHDEYEEFSHIEHLYQEAFKRYRDVASQAPPPISADIDAAVEMCVAWLADWKKLDERGQLAVSTTAIRAYLWRTVEGGPTHMLEPELTAVVKSSFDVGDDRSPDEPLGLTYYFAASQCMIDVVHTRFGSIGARGKGPKSYERAFWDTTDDLQENGLELDEATKRQAFQFGICLADVERVIERQSPD
jgi:hypothetical protein